MGAALPQLKFLLRNANLALAKAGAAGSITVIAVIFPTPPKDQFSPLLEDVWSVQLQILNEWGLD